MRKAAEDQVTKSQDLVKAAQQQVAIAADQLEGQIRPALVARVNRHGVELLNIGSGPALHVQLSPAKRSLGAVLAVHPFPEPHDRIAFLEARQAVQTVVQCQLSPDYPKA